VVAPCVPPLARERTPLPRGSPVGRRPITRGAALPLGVPHARPQAQALRPRRFVHEVQHDRLASPHQHPLGLDPLSSVARGDGSLPVAAHIREGVAPLSVGRDRGRPAPVARRRSRHLCLNARERIAGLTSHAPCDRRATLHGPPYLAASPLGVAQGTLVPSGSRTKSSTAVCSFLTSTCLVTGLCPRADAVTVYQAGEEIL